MVEPRVYLGQTSVLVVQRHLARYVFALRWVDKRRVCDVGSGSGYGSWLLAQYAGGVVGVEVDEEAYKGAISRFGNLPNLKFIRQNWLGDMDEEPFDVIVAFEVMEHLPDLNRGLELCRERLHPGGNIVMSLPINCGYNEYHLTGDMNMVDCVAAISAVFPDGCFFYHAIETESERDSNVLIAPITPGGLGYIPSGCVVFAGRKPK